VRRFDGIDDAQRRQRTESAPESDGLGYAKAVRGDGTRRHPCVGDGAIDAMNRTGRRTRLRGIDHPDLTQCLQFREDRSCFAVALDDSHCRRHPPTQQAYDNAANRVIATIAVADAKHGRSER
jgi:hypothetical protein